MKISGQKKLIVERLVMSQDGICPLCNLSLEPDLSLLIAYYDDVRDVSSVNRYQRAKRTSINIDIDHIIPRSKGGVTELFNLQVTHRKCNNKKSDNL